MTQSSHRVISCCRLIWLRDTARAAECDERVGLRVCAWFRRHVTATAGDSSERLFLIFIIVSSLLLPYPCYLPILLSFISLYFFHSFPIRVSECWFIAGAEGMSLHVYIAHTGEHFLADPVSFASYVHSIYLDSCLKISFFVSLLVFTLTNLCSLRSLAPTPFGHGLPVILPYPPRGRS